MKRLLITLILVYTMNNILNAQNPFFGQYQTPHGTVPFDRIKTEHYEPAILEGIKQQNAELDAIIQNPEKATFTNTIEAYEQSGRLLDKVTAVFGNMLSAETNDDLQALAQKIMPLLSEHSNNITLNEKLFARVKEVYGQKQSLQLTQEQNRLLDDIYDSFVRHGANLEGEAREQYRQLTNELSKLTLDFSENNLKETNRYQMLLTDKASIAGLPEIIVEAAAETARSEDKEGWAFTLHAPSYVPFMTYADNRELRHKLYIAYNTKCTHDNEFNNIEIVKKLVNTRMKIAQLLGYKDYAEYTLKKRMAENSDAVYKLLNQLLEAYTPTAQKEYLEVQELAREEQGDDFIVMPWDWSYYSNKLKNKKFNINEEMLRPYFELEQVKKGVFGLAERLYGITFRKNTEIPVYHKDVEAYEVFDKDGKFLSVLYTDFHPRPGKRAGAWMTSYKEQWIDPVTGEDSRPHISVVMNFTKPTESKPALLTFNEVETFLHEFGHSLHGMFANSTYQSLSGTNVYWDFVELPSQIMENFAIEKEFLNTFARHYETGEVLPDELIQRLVDASNFNAAYACLRQVSFGLLDMAWYTRNTPFEGDVKAYEQEAWKDAQVLPIVKEACMSTQFSHIFAGGYSAGYYSYKWAEVLDADAFSLFKQQGIFNREVADSFRNNILSKGGTEHPMVLYKRFRGQEPTIDALLIRNGIKKQYNYKRRELDMKKRLILKVLGLLLLLPMFSGCNDTDDVAGIFTGKTWKLTYITVKDSHQMFNFWGNDNKAREQSMKLLDETGRYVITFNGMEESNIITGTLSGTVITSTFTGSWSANGKDNQFNASIQGGNESSDILAKNFIEGLNNATSYGGDERNLYLYYKPSGSQQTLSLVFHVVK